MVQTVHRDRSMAADGSDFESQLPKEKIERFPVLEGIRKCVKEHRQVLLVGRPGSGKSTTLARLLLEEARAALPSGSQDFANDPFSNPLLGGARGGLVSGAIDSPTPPYGHPSEEGIGRVTDFARIPVLVELRLLGRDSLLDLIQASFQRYDLQLDRTQIEDLLFHQRLLLWKIFNLPRSQTNKMIAGT
jgi:energy-coupling factor transporter ATP-binding protein EcfA2